MASALRTVSYRNGTVRFRIPRHWIEEDLGDQGAVYYPPDRETPTLRLSVLTFSREDDQSLEAIESDFKARMKPGSVLKRNRNGHWTISNSSIAEEAGVALRMFYWEVAKPYPPGHLQLAIFSLTSNESESADGALPPQYRWVEEEIDRVAFPTKLQTH